MRPFLILVIIFDGGDDVVGSGGGGAGAGAGDGDSGNGFSGWSHWYAEIRTRAQELTTKVNSFCKCQCLHICSSLMLIIYLVTFSAAIRAQPTSNNLSFFACRTAHHSVHVYGKTGKHTQCLGTRFCSQNGFLLFIFCAVAMLFYKYLVFTTFSAICGQTAAHMAQHQTLRISSLFLLFRLWFLFSCLIKIWKIYFFPKSNFVHFAELGLLGRHFVNAFA